METKIQGPQQDRKWLSSLIPLTPKELQRQESELLLHAQRGNHEAAGHLIRMVSPFVEARLARYLPLPTKTARICAKKR